MKSHYGSIENDTQERRLYDLLRKHPGEWYSGWSLVTLIPSMAVHTVVHGLRQQLADGETIENKTEWRPALKRRESYYRLVRE